ncbi:MAG TPA: hypothetical protein VFG33_22010 [Kribbella sp.]|uniref:GH12 family glycosyl hydrolase domain-containing protein n=1 Tax=Kribbella sp. TaxID=1871183 RepID=UPI002D78CDAB|nr:hypothetical protein [Kribbella sp.]HET6296075.1 hypothetical protein [Kribbella sp.]
MPSLTGSTRRRVIAVLIAVTAVVAGSAVFYATQDSPNAVTAAAADQPGGTSQVESCTNPSFTTTSTNNEGDGRSYGAYYVHNNMWNNENGTYTLGVCNFDNWYEVATQPDGTAVRAYPNVHKDYSDKPLSTIQSAKFAADSPRCDGCIYNVAFDIWINKDFDNELMIWTENFNQRPAGDQVGRTTVGGHEYEVWKSGGATTPGGIFTYVSVTPQLSGTMPLQLFFKDLEARKWIPANSTTWQVDFGVEVCDTNNTPQRFNFTDFAITES